MMLREQTQVPVVRAEVIRAHNYSTQMLNSTELANEALRTVLQEVGGLEIVVHFILSACECNTCSTHINY